jgi:hypothetical protein
LEPFGNAPNLKDYSGSIKNGHRKHSEPKRLLGHWILYEIAIGNTMNHKGFWGYRLDEDLHSPWMGSIGNTLNQKGSWGDWIGLDEELIHPPWMGGL